MTADLAAGREGRQDVWLLAALFFLARAMAALWFVPAVNSFSEILYPHAALSDAGAYPFIHYWVEYPPVVPWLSVGVYKLVGLVLGAFGVGAGDPAQQLLFAYRWYTVAMQWVMAAFDTGNLALIYLIVREKDGARAAFRAGWVYALLFYPALVAISYFDSFVLFWLLLSMLLFVRNRPLGSAAALAVGFMSKVVPIVFVPVALKYLPTWRRRAAWLGAFAVVTAVIAGPFLAVAPGKLGAMAGATAARRPWETVWALAEGYTGYGMIGPEAQHLEPGRVKRWRELAGPDADAMARIATNINGTGLTESGYYRVISRFSDELDYIERGRRAGLYRWAAVPFLALLGWLLWRGRPEPTRVNVLAFSLAALCIFLIYSKGWSPQFALYPMALCLLALGPIEGPAAALALGIINYIEMLTWRIWPSLSGEPSDSRLLAVAVIARTALLAAVLVLCVRRLVSPPASVGDNR